MRKITQRRNKTAQNGRFRIAVPWDIFGSFDKNNLQTSAPKTCATAIKVKLNAGIREIEFTNSMNVKSIKYRKGYPINANNPFFCKKYTFEFSCIKFVKEVCQISAP